MTELLKAEQILEEMHTEGLLPMKEIAKITAEALIKGFELSDRLQPIVNEYFKRFLYCSKCESVDEHLSQEFISRRNAVANLLTKKIAEFAANRIMLYDLFGVVEK